MARRCRGRAGRRRRRGQRLKCLCNINRSRKGGAMSNKTMQSHVSRRGVLKGAAAVAGLGALGAFPAFGQTDKKIVLSTWGGDYAKLLTKHVSAAVLTPKGWTVVNDEAQVVQRKAKTVAEKRLPKGTSDVQALTATDIAELTAIGRAGAARSVQAQERAEHHQDVQHRRFAAVLAAHLQRQGRPLQPEADQGRAEGHGRDVGSEEPGQGRHRRHPARLHDHGGGAGRRAARPATSTRPRRRCSSSRS